jgi:hypothetical protein
VPKSAITDYAPNFALQWTPLTLRRRVFRCRRKSMFIGEVEPIEVRRYESGGLTVVVLNGGPGTPGSGRGSCAAFSSSGASALAIRQYTFDRILPCGGSCGRRTASCDSRWMVLGSHARSFLRGPVPAGCCNLLVDSSLEHWNGQSGFYTKLNRR